MHQSFAILRKGGVMIIQFTCGSCGKTLRVSNSSGGKKGKCPSCRAKLLVPNATGAKETEASPDVEIDDDAPAYQPEIDEPTRPVHRRGNKRQRRRQQSLARLGGIASS